MTTVPRRLHQKPKPFPERVGVERNLGPHIFDMIELIDANNVLRRDWEHVDPSKTRARMTFEQSTPNQIWVWDGYNHNARRREIHPGYKMNRTAPAEDMFAGLALMREILSHSQATQIEVEGWEADDVIATLAHKYCPNYEVLIRTNDLDYYQLLTLPNLLLPEVRKPYFDPKYITLYKTMVGDPSDNIPGLSGFGPKAFDSLTPYWDDMIDAFYTQTWSVLRNLPVKPKQKALLMDDEVIQELFSYWKIVQMMDVPWELIEQGLKAGRYDPVAAEELFTRFML